MYVNLICSCEAALEVDVPDGDESAGWALIMRFCNAHVGCGYVTPMEQVDAVQKQ